MSKSYKPKIDKKSGRIGDTHYVDELNIKKGARVMLITNIDVADLLSNGSVARVGNRPKFSLSDMRHLDPSCRARDETITRRFTRGQVAVELNVVSGETGRAGC